ncbi:MAG: hypothetical protein WCW56_00855 [Candidatus Paceibacterota bacterium]|jgi:hypothetical protein
MSEPSQEEIERAYGEGREAAEKADFIDLVAHGVGDIVGGPPDPIEDARDKGFHDKCEGR